MKRILSIQGGGIRGILPCLALCELERQTGKLTRDLFDFVGGTSTGALLAATIAAGIPAADSLKVYTQSGPKIFSPSDSIRRRLLLIAKGRQFDNQTLRRVMSDTFGDRAVMRMNDSKIDICLTAGNMSGVPWYFTNDRPTNAKTTGSAPLIDAAVASACATTYHDPWLVPDFGYFSDGGTVGLADPVYQVCVEAFTGPKCYGSIDPADAKVISLGTGFFKPAKVPGPPDNLLENIQWVTSSLIGSSKTIAQECVERHWPGVLQAYNVQMPDDIDEADVDRISLLVSMGKDAAANMDWGKILA